MAGQFRLVFAGSQTQGEQLTLARNAEAAVSALLVGHDAGGLDAHQFADFLRGAALQDAAEHIEFSLR